MEEFKNELHTELLGVHSLNSFAKHNSSARSVMFSSHFSQHLVLDKGDEKRIQSGTEQEFGKYTFSVKMPESGKIIKIIERYPQGVGQDSLSFSPETIVIYENEQTKEIDYFSIPYYASYHQFFGFKYDVKEGVNQLKPGNFVAKDTVFADSPGVADNSNYKFGLDLNIAFMSIPSVAEDGVMISEDVLPRFKFRLFETRTVEFGTSQFPLNLYGTKDVYKPFPEIGDYIRDDGILMMLRSYDDCLMPVEFSVFDTMEPDFIFDKGVYVRGGRGKVVDIKVVSNNNQIKQLPDAMTGYISKYEHALQKFHQEIISTEQKLRFDNKKKFGESRIKLSPKFHRLLVESLAIVNHNSTNLKQSLNLLYRKAPIDEFRIDFVVEYEMQPNIGFKISGLSGDKGVICAIEKPENMPVDANGNRADIVMDAASTISRMNLGRLYEHYISGAARDVSDRLRSMVNVKQCDIGFIANLPDELFNQAYDYLLGFYKITSSRQYDYFSNAIDKEDKYEHLTDVINKGIYLYYPIESEKDTTKVIKDIEEHYKPVYGPVTYVGNSGQRVTTNSNVRIAPLYVMLLDKIADDWSSVSSGKLQHFGVLAPMTKSEKFMYPYRNSPVRTIGETEGRIFAGYCGREAIAEMMDRSNSPNTQRSVVWNILNAPNPGDIDHVIDRERIELGNTRPLQLVRHILGVAGLSLVYEPEGK